MHARASGRHHWAARSGRLTALVIAASAIATPLAATPLPPNLPRPTGPDRHHADKCALFARAGGIGHGHILTGTDETERPLRAIIDRLQHDVFWDDMVLRCPHFSVRSAGHRIGERGFDGFGWSADGRYASIADNYLPNSQGVIGRECLFERVRGSWRYRGCVGTYGA